MPPVIVPGVPGNVYDFAYTILNSARMRLNDKLKSIYPTGGNILEETQASTLQAFNNGYRRLQDTLCDAGAERFHQDVIILNVPAVTNFDPASQCSISWFNCFDGTNLQVAPVLPGDLILPLWMSERPSGQNAPFPWPDNPNMTPMTDGLPRQPKYQRNFWWEWRADAIYYPGAIVQVDFAIRYRAYLPDLTDVGTTRWWNVSVPIMRCADPLSWWICAEFAAARASDGAADNQMLAVSAACQVMAMEATKKLANRDVSKNQRAPVRRIPYGSSTRGRGYGSGYMG